MEKEVLESRIAEGLGSTQLQLTQETLDVFYEETLADITDDSQVDDKFIERKVNYLKKLNGQLHSDVAKQVDIYKKQIKPVEKKKPAEGNKGEEGGGSGNDELEQLRKDFNDLKSAYDAEKDSARRKELLGEVSKGLKSKFTKAGIEANSYILKQTLKELDITKDENGNSPDVDDLVKKAESAYFKSMKEAGLEKRVAPGVGNRTGKGGKSVVDEFFNRKRTKEHWGNAKK